LRTCFCACTGDTQRVRTNRIEIRVRKQSRGGRMADKLFRVLSLDGGGAKGFYTLGILREMEAMIGCSIHEKFDLIFGTSTGAIIASMLALGKTVEEVHETYTKHVPTVMQKSTPGEKSN